MVRGGRDRFDWLEERRVIAFSYTHPLPPSIPPSLPTCTWPPKQIGWTFHTRTLAPFLKPAPSPKTAEPRKTGMVVRAEEEEKEEEEEEEKEEEEEEE